MRYSVKQDSLLKAQRRVAGDVVSCSGVMRRHRAVAKRRVIVWKDQRSIAQVIELLR